MNTDKPTLNADTSKAERQIAELQQRLADHGRGCPTCATPGHDIDHGWLGEDGVRYFDSPEAVLDERNLLREIFRDDEQT